MTGNKIIFKLQFATDKKMGIVKVGVKEIGVFQVIHWIAELPIVRDTGHGPVVKIEGGEVFLPTFQLPDLGTPLGDAAILQKALVSTFREQVRRAGNTMIPCRAAGKGPTPKSKKVKVEVMREFYDCPSPSMPTKERVSRSFTVPSSQLKESEGKLFVAGWVIEKKLGPGETLAEKRWMGEDVFRQQVDGWFSDLHAILAEEENKREEARAERQRKAEEAEARREAAADEDISDLKPAEVREIVQRIRNTDGAVRALAIGRGLQGLTKQHRELVVRGLDAGKTASDALSEAQQVAKGEKRAKAYAKKVARFSQMEQKHGVSVKYKVWERENQQFFQKPVTVENCSVYFSGTRAYIVEDDDLDSAVIKSRESLEILS